MTGGRRAGRDSNAQALGSSTAASTQDEDRNPRRGGSLERDQPTSPPIETLKRPCAACSHAVTKRTRGDAAMAVVEARRGKPLEG
jgi:hypothetical protein